MGRLATAGTGYAAPYYGTYSSPMISTYSPGYATYGDSYYGGGGPEYEEYYRRSSY